MYIACEAYLEGEDLPPPNFIFSLIPGGFGDSSTCSFDFLNGFFDLDFFSFSFLTFFPFLAGTTFSSGKC